MIFGVTVDSFGILIFLIATWIFEILYLVLGQKTFGT